MVMTSQPWRRQTALYTNGAGYGVSTRKRTSNGRTARFNSPALLPGEPYF